MNGYADVGSFLYNEKEQKAELAAFGLILYERLTLAKTEKISYKDFFQMHEGLAECLSYITDGESVSARARAAANVRHAENRSMKADVFTWLNANMVNFKSMDSAAEAITKQQPITFRTARDWIGEWKKLRSTGTP